MRGMAFGHMSGVSALVALALGYIVYILAQKEKGLLKTIGRIIGAAIIAISSLIVIVKILYTAKFCIKTCPLKGSVMAPMTERELPKK